MKNIRVLAALLAVCFALGGCVAVKLNGETTAETTAETTVETTAETAAETTVAESTADVTEEEYVANYPNGYDYASSDISKHVTLGEYNGLKVELNASEELSDEELAEIIFYYRSQYSTVGDPITDRAAMLTDSVNIDYEGTLDGVKFDGGTANGQTLVLGQGGYIPGFEEGIVGMSVGEIKTIDATFPEDYGVEELNGKTVQFKITLNSISPSELPEYNDKFVADNFSSYGMNTVKEFEDYFKADYAYNLIEQQNKAVLEVVTSASKINGYPDGLVEDYANQQISTEKGYADMYGMEFSEYVSMGYGVTLEEYEKTVKESAKGMIAQEMVIYAVAAAEGVTVSDEELANEIANYIVYYGYETEEELIEAMGMSEELFYNSVKFSVTYNKVLGILRNNTTFIYVK